MDKSHNPEFTCMELYVQYKDYNWMMAFTEKLLERICIAVNGSTESVVDGKTISFKAPYRRPPILEAIKEKTGYDLNGKSEEEIREICKALNLEIDDTMGKGKLMSRFSASSARVLISNRPLSRLSGGNVAAHQDAPE
ncbi:MAG: amino acid--tRNA ligase-related protein [Parabacteroides merdae]